MSIFVLALGLGLAAFGGERFVRGVVGLAEWLRVPPGVIGATVAAFATSSPELTVGVLSAIDHRSELAFGDATGSNMVNLGVVLGGTLVLSAITIRRVEVRRDLIGFFVALALLAISSVDGEIGRAEAMLLVALFLAWLVWVIQNARRERSEIGLVGDVRRWPIVANVAIGLVLLVVAGQLIVTAAKGIGESLGWSQFVIGSIVVAIGTSTPELVTTIVATRRGHIGVGIGTILGSNIFNSLLIVGVAGAISPIEVSLNTAFIALFAAFVAGLLVIPNSRSELAKRNGILLIATYAIFVVALVSVGEIA
jgi:cation:H+ antiporter